MGQSLRTCSMVTKDIYPLVFVFFLFQTTYRSPSLSTILVQCRSLNDIHFIKFVIELPHSNLLVSNCFFESLLDSSSRTAQIYSPSTTYLSNLSLSYYIQISWYPTVFRISLRSKFSYSAIPLQRHTYQICH